MPILHRYQSGSRSSGFTLLELLAALLLFAGTVLPLLVLVHKARMRASQYSIQREVQELAQRQLFDRIYTYSQELVEAGSMEALEGTFEEFGHPDWTWEIPYPEVVSQGQQVLLEYRILVYTPHGARPRSGGADADTGGFAGLIESFTGGGAGSLSRFGETPTFEMSTWALPTAQWYLEQQDLAVQGVDVDYYPGGMTGGF